MNVGKERCSSVFNGDRCEKKQGHKGKHGSFHGLSGEIQFVSWTDAGAQEFEREKGEVTA